MTHVCTRTSTTLQVIMATTFRPYAPDQPHLFPPSPEECLPRPHLAYFVSDAVDTCDLTPFYAPYLGDGRRNSPYAPRMMLKGLIYDYLPVDKTAFCGIPADS